MTLIELMVGLAVGLITTLAIAQTYASAEGYRRGMLAGGDAQVNGAMALYALQHEVQTAGYGFATIPSVVGCPLAWNHGGSAGRGVLAPVAITPGVGAQPDRLTVMSSSSVAASMPMRVVGPHAAGSGAFDVDSSLGVAPGALLVAVPQPWGAGAGCGLFAAGRTVSATRISHDPAASPWNAQLGAVFPAAGYADGSLLVDLGDALLREYSLNGRTLQVRTLQADDPAGTTRELYDDIVMLRALYGKDTDGDGVVDVYDSNTASLTTAAAWNQVLALRIAVVARSPERDKATVQQAPVEWDLGRIGPPNAYACNQSHRCVRLFDPKAADDSDHYRYKVYDTVVPLRNVLWNS